MGSLVIFFLVEIGRLGIVVAPGRKAVAVLSVWVTGMLVGTTVHLQWGSMVICPTYSDNRLE